MAGPSKKVHVSDEEVLYDCCKIINIVIFLRTNIVVTVKYENFIMW
jgi:hypothetical protein